MATVVKTQDTAGLEILKQAEISSERQARKGLEREQETADLRQKVALLRG